MKKRVRIGQCKVFAGIKYTLVYTYIVDKDERSN